MIIAKRDHLERIAAAKPLQNVIDDLTNCDIKQLAAKLAKFDSWDRPRGDLYHWVPVLNRIDEVFEQQVNKYNLSDEYARPHELEPQDLDLLVSALNFTYILLEHCSNRSIYNSAHRLYDLLNSPSVPLRLAALKVCVSIGERFSQTGSSKYSATSKVKRKILRLATYFPLQVPSVSGAEHFSLLDCLDIDKKYPGKWKSIEFQYFRSVLTSVNKKHDMSPSSSPSKQHKKTKNTEDQSQIDPNPPSSASTTSSKKISKKNKNKNKNKVKTELITEEGTQAFVINEESVRKLTLQQIYDKACDSIPKESWFEFGLMAPIAKAFNNKSFESIKLREQLVQIKCLSIAFTTCMGSTASTASKLFESEPYLFSHLVDLINLESKNVPKDVYFNALRTLECISLKRVWGSDLVRTMSGNVTHGMLFQTLRIIQRQVKEETENIPEDCYIHFFNLLSNLIESKTLVSILTSAGIITHLMEILTVKSKYRWVLSASVHLLNLLLTSSTEAFELFVENGGFNKLIESIGYEVQFCLDNPNYDGGAPKDAVVYYTISFRQANFLKNLLKFDLNLIQTDSSDRMRNLFDSPLLFSFNKIIQNPNVFGPSIVTTTLDTISSIIHNEPTAFPILNEANIIDNVLGNFEQLMGPSHDLLLSLPEIIGAVSLNNDGLKKVQDLDVMSKLFNIFTNLEYAKVLVLNDSSSNLGGALDELARHYPVLKSSIIKGVKRIVKDVPPRASQLLPGVQFFHSPKGSLYKSPKEEVIDNEEGCKELDTWDSSDGAYLMDNLCMFLGSLIQDSGAWRNLMNEIKHNDLLPILTLENAPFDYIYSSGLFSIDGIFKYFDEEDREYGLPNLLAEIQVSLIELEPFIYYDDHNNSYFVQLEDDPEAGTELLKKLTTLTTLMANLASLYMSPTSLFPARCTQLANFFATDNGIKIIKYFGALFKRCGVEEALIRSSMPSSVAKETIHQSRNEAPPLQIYTEEPAEVTGKLNKTSAKFKNTIQIRFLMDRIQSFISSAFASLVRVPTSKKQELGLSEFRRNIVHFSEELAFAVLDLLNVQIKDELIESSYVIMIINFMVYILTSRSRGNEHVQIVFSMCLLQNKGFIILRDIIIKSWRKLLNLDTVNNSNTINYLKNTPEAIHKNIIGQGLLLFTKLVSSDSVLPLPFATLYYADGAYGESLTHSALHASFLVQTRIIALDLLKNLLDTESDEFQEDERLKKIPTILVDYLINIAKNIFLEKGESDPSGAGLFYALNWRNVSPSMVKCHYLESIGMSPDMAIAFVNIGDMSLLRDGNFPHNPHLDIDDSDWQTYVSNYRANPYVELKAEPMPPQIGNYRSLDDLKYLRRTSEDTFVDQWLLIAQIFPKSVQSISELLNSDCTRQLDSEDLSLQVLEYLYSFDIELEEHSQKIASMLHLYGLLLQDEKVFNKSFSSIEGFLNYFVAGLESQYANRAWFSYGLLVLERILSSSDSPIIEEFNMETEISISRSQTPFIVDQETSERIFESILEIDSVSSVNTSLSLVRILILYAKSSEYAARISKSDLLKRLIRAVNSFISSDKNSAYQNSILVLVRRCFETTDVIKATISLEFTDLFKGARKGTKDLSTIVKETAPLVLRDPEVYSETISKGIRLEFCEEPLGNLMVRPIPKDLRPKEDVTMTDAQTGEIVDSNESKSTEVIEQTSIVHTLLSELMQLSKEDWTSDPLDDSPVVESSSTEPLSPKAKEKEKEKEKKRAEVLSNPYCAYACFLLQTMVELLSSYKQSKLEFLTFSKKQSSHESQKPSSTALNFFIHQLIPTEMLTNTGGSVFERKCAVSTMARLVILAFVSTAVDDSKLDYKKEDPDMTFIRKFTIDTLLKIFRETNASSEVANSRYSKIVDFAELSGALLSPKYREMLGSCLNKEVTKLDTFFIGRVMLEKNIVAQFTTILSNLDLNFPEAKKVYKFCIKPINLLGTVKAEHQDLFKETGEGEEEEVVSDEYDFREETPDLFKNSTLGMYDVDDIDSEDDELDYLDEGLQGPVDIVYSEDESHSSDDSENDDSDEDLDNSSDESDLSVVSMHEVQGEIDEDDDMSDDYSDEDEDSHHHHHHLHSHLDISGDEDDISEDQLDDEDEDDEDDIEIIDMTLNSDGESLEEGDDEDGDDYGDFYSFDDEADEEQLGSEEGDEDEDDWIERFETMIGHDVHHHGEHEEDIGDELRDDSSGTPSFAGDDEDDEDSVLDENDGYTTIIGNNDNDLGVRARFINHALPRLGLTVNGPLSTAIPSSGEGEFGEFLDRLLSSRQGTFGRSLGVSRLPLRQFQRLLQPIGGKRESGHILNLQIKSTKERWIDTSRMFHEKDSIRVASRIIPAIVNKIFELSSNLWKQERDEQDRIRKVKEEEEKQKREEQERLKREEEVTRQQIAEISNEEHVPIMVRIGDEEVDIGGTDIDPEFFEALPDYMREEVFTQHIRERRARRTEGDETREIDPDFLDALPDSMREEILQQEALARQTTSLESQAIERGWSVLGGDNTNDEDVIETQTAKKSSKQKIYFTPLIDRLGVPALVRLIYVPQSFNSREHFHKVLEYLCYNKQTRAEVMGLIIFILEEGTASQKSLEKSFTQISGRAQVLQQAKVGDGKSSMTTLQIKENATHQFPNGSNPLIVATQCIEALLYLLEQDPHMRYYFLTEHDNPYIGKKFKVTKLKLKDYTSKSIKYPVNYLLDLLNKKLVYDEPGLMDILSRTLQVTTRPLQSLKKVKEEHDEHEHKESEEVKDEDETDHSGAKSGRDNVKTKTVKQFDPPFIPDQNLRKIVSILVANECSSKTFQQTLGAMQNLSVLPNAQKVFPVELSDSATKLGKLLIKDLNQLVKEIKESTKGEVKGEAFARFTPASSHQAKLLRVLTALDYLFDSKQNSEAQTLDEIETLTSLYKQLALGTLWDALSDCLRILEDKSELSHVATALLPLIEALMVVCKHSKVKELQLKDVLKYEARKIDFTKEPIENLFFSFTDEHKKILNQIVRSNPKLMSGSFSMLVRNPRVLEFDNKKNFFDRKLHTNKEDRSTINVSVRRDQVFLDSYRSLFFKSSEEFRKAKLDINFKGEAGIDAGGVTREWFQVLSRQMFNADYALFTPVASDKTTFHPNRTSYANPEHLSFFKFIGRIIGKAIYDSCFLDCHFSRAVYKRILSRPVSLKDMENLDLDYFKSLMWMLENDITDIITETFSVDTDDYGEHKVIDLIEGGHDIPVTEENKHEYVRCVVEYRLQTSVSEQMNNFLIGFHEIIPKELIAIFDEQELELLISGLPDIDVDDWKNNSMYNNYSPSSPQIQWFWRAVKSFDAEERAKLLQFATGTSKVPLNGFKELGGVNGVSKFSIHRDYGSTERLPSSHTCFNQIDLPEYDSYETLRGSLLVAITEGHEGFGLA